MSKKDFPYYVMVRQGQNNLAKSFLIDKELLDNNLKVYRFWARKLSDIEIEYVAENHPEVFAKEGISVEILKEEKTTKPTQKKKTESEKIKE